MLGIISFNNKIEIIKKFKLQVKELNAIIVIVLLIVNIPLYKIIFRLIFRDYDDFEEAVKYSFTPDIYSLFKGRYWKDQIGEAKLSFFALACIIAIVVEYSIIKALINMFI